MKEQQTNENEVIEVDHINEDNYQEYIGKTVKVTGDVVLSVLGLTKLPINFTEVGGSFYCSSNELPSLDDATKVAVRISEEAITPPLDAKEQAIFIAGFQECIKWLNVVFGNDR